MLKQERLRIIGALFLTAACLSIAADLSPAQVRIAAGKLAGVVRDTTGTPQMGATVEVLPEALGTAAQFGFLTNTQGIFRGDRIQPGLYTVRVTLAGFLPTLQQHVRINSHLTTVLRIELESMFASLNQLRQQPAPVAVQDDDWKWVLRSATVARPALQWADDDAQTAANTDVQNAQPRARLDFTDGSRRPGSTSNIPSAPATEVAYDQKIGSSRLLLASEMNYDGTAPGGGFATVWLPTGSLSGAHSALVVREAQLGPQGPTFHGLRLDQTGALALGNAAVVRYGGEFVLMGITHSTSAIRPRVELDLKPTDGWQTAFIFASETGDNVSPKPDSDERQMSGELAGALNELDQFPTLLWHGNRPVLEGGWHEEIAAEHKLNPYTQLQFAVFHDDESHVAVFGRGNDLPATDYLQDPFSNEFAYDGGHSSSWGTRVALREKLTQDVDLTAVYAYAGVLSSSKTLDGPMRDLFRTAMYHSLGANVSAKLPASRTKLDGGYKWVSGVAISRLDPFGESLYDMEPFAHLGIRQPLPRFGRGRWEANARCDNLFAQGYVSMNTQDGHAVLVPAFRTFRGGVSVQF